MLHIVDNTLTTHDVLCILIYIMINITTNVKHLIHSPTGNNPTQICEGPSVTIQTFTAAGNKVLVEATKARVYHVHALRNALELAHQAPMLYVPHM